MTGNPLRTPIAISLTAIANDHARRSIELTGRAWPCKVEAVSGQIVTVSYLINTPIPLPTVEMPIATPVYDWLPVQVGDQGLAIPADVYLGGVSGLGGGTADLSLRGNLATQVFLSVSNISWAPAGGDATKRAVQGPGGVFLATSDGATTVEIDATSGNITIKVADGKKVYIQSTGTPQPVKLADNSNSVVLLAQ